MFGLRSIGRRGRARGVSVGLAVVGEEAVVVAVGQSQSGTSHRIVAWDSFSISGDASLAQGLSRFVDANGMRGAPARVTLSATDYSLKLVERPPNVLDAELADATRWLVKDLVEVDVETAAIAVLTVPEQRGRARAPHMFVVATPESIVESFARSMTKAGLVCVGFEVVETAMLALESRCLAPANAGAMIRMDGKSSVLTLASEGRLFLARPLRADLAAIDDAAQRALSANEVGAGEAVSALEPLLLDVQRSLDYYESEHGRAPAARLTLLPGAIDLAPLAPGLNESLRPLRVEAFAIERSFAFQEPPPTRLHAALALAGGAAVADGLGLGDALIPARLRHGGSELGLARVLVAAGAVALLLFAFAGHQVYRLVGEREVMRRQVERAAQIQRELEAASASAAAEAAAADASVDPAVLRSERDARLALLRDLGQAESNGADSRFSTLLAGLARRDVEGTWLERIELGEAGATIALTGRALAARDIPDFLKRLRDEPAFAGRRFGELAIERPQASAVGLRFRVATEGQARVEAGAKP